MIEDKCWFSALLENCYRNACFFITKQKIDIDLVIITDMLQSEWRLQKLDHGLKAQIFDFDAVSPAAVLRGSVAN